MKGLVDLVCPDCGRKWSVARKRGRLPALCPVCRGSKSQHFSNEKIRLRRDMPAGGYVCIECVLEEGFVGGQFGKEELIESVLAEAWPYGMVLMNLETNDIYTVEGRGFQLGAIMGEPALRRYRRLLRLAGIVVEPTIERA